MGEKLLFLGCGLLVSLYCWSQPADSTALRSFVDQIIIKANVDTQTDVFTVQQGPDRLELAANNQYRVFVSLDYEFIGASIGFAPSFLPQNNDEEAKGKSSFTDYGFRFFLGNWTQNLQYRQTEGFYVENTNDFIPGVDLDLYLQFPDFKVTYWGGATAYVMNPKFSLRNVVYNTEWQLQSAGSLVPSFTYGLTRISATLLDGKEYDNSLDFALSPAYYYTWVVHENWFVAPYLSPAIGVRFTSSGKETSDRKSREVYTPFSLDGGLQLGYSSRRIIGGLQFNFESTWYREDPTTTIQNDLWYAKVYVGYRFDPPMMVRKLFHGNEAP